MWNILFWLWSIPGTSIADGTHQTSMCSPLTLSTWSTMAPKLVTQHRINQFPVSVTDLQIWHIFMSILIVCVSEAPHVNTLQHSRYWDEIPSQTKQVTELNGVTVSLTVIIMSFNISLPWSFFNFQQISQYISYPTIWTLTWSVCMAEHILRLWTSS